jgi:hypothetical protein
VNAAVALVALALAWIGWELAGWLVAWGAWPVAPLLQRGALFVLALGALEWAMQRVGARLSGEDRGSSH